MKIYLKSFLTLILGVYTYSCAFAEGKLIFAIDLVRHGDRTPLMDSPEMQKIWPRGAGELTPEGMHQGYQLGERLRKLYVKQTHLLPAQYDAKTIKVRSSGLSRTMMSAQSILLGLYPLGTGPSLDEATYALPNGFQPIPIHIVPPEQDTLLLPPYDNEFETYILNDPEWVQKEAQLKPYYAGWSKIANIPIRNLFELLHFSDRLFIERLYHMPLPQGISTTEADMILESGKWALIKIANHPKWAVLMGKELAKTIQQEMRLSTEQTRPLKYILFVAHDSTIAAQLKLLGQNVNDYPPYAAQLHYELFDTGASHYEVRVSYLQQPLWINACGGYTCSLNEFITLLNEGE